VKGETKPFKLRKVNVIGVTLLVTTQMMVKVGAVLTSTLIPVSGAVRVSGGKVMDETGQALSTPD